MVHVIAPQGEFTDTGSENLTELIVDSHHVSENVKMKTQREGFLRFLETAVFLCLFAAAEDLTHTISGLLKAINFTFLSYFFYIYIHLLQSP